MNRNFISLVFVLKLLEKEVLSGNFRKWEVVTSLSDVNFTAHIVWQGQESNVILCGQKCFHSEDCSSFAYNDIDQSCQAYNNESLSKDDNGFVMTSGVKYFVPSACSIPPVVSHAMLTKPQGDVSIGSTRTYTCDAGYVMIGSAEITCQSNSTWTSIQFECRDCGNPPSVSSASVNSGNNLVRTNRTYTCNNGYAMVPSLPDITCQSDATWSSVQFGCVNCGIPPSVSLATVNSGNTLIGTTRTYTCDNGYAMVPSLPDITCQSDATWSSIQFSCVDCGNPPSIDRATLNSGNNLVGTTRYYTCFAEHHTEGTTSITCQSNGQWTSTDLYCRIYRWPLGTYGLYKTTSGCPSDGSSWEDGFRYYDTEDDNPGNGWSGDIPSHMSGGFSDTAIKNDFCMRTSETATTDDLPWQSGSYCLLKKGNCPSGFSESSLYWDDENSNNNNNHGGTMPDGGYDRNTRIYYCCRSDGSASNPLYLPTSTPFYLSRKGGTCQTVAGMNVQQESVRYDCDDDEPSDTSYIGDIPDYTPDPTNWNLIFCYYYK